MKKLFLILGAAGMLAACNQSSNQAAIDKLSALYKKSYELKDIPTAITAVQLLLQHDSTNALRDSLPSMYFAVQNVTACLATTEQSLTRYPDNEDFLNLKLLSLEQRGEGEKVMEIATKLYTKTGKAEYIYKQASVQLVTGDFETAGKTIQTMMDKYKDSKDSVEIFIDQTQAQRVPVLAACWNMKGYMFIQKQQYQQAADAYQKAIQTFPDFVMARRNLQQLVQGLQQR